jgi:hypothetical protein
MDFHVFVSLGIFGSICIYIVKIHEYIYNGIYDIKVTLYEKRSNIAHLTM